ncbi:MAG: efflux RND transporter periplasmic adaptor subunit, partial [Planctomycetota bacterium]
MRPLSVLGPLSFLAGLLFFTGCGETPTPEANSKPPKVVCVTAKTQTITDYDEFVGRTEAAESVIVQARVSGFLQTVEFEDGQMVRAGDLLATIEPDEYQAIHDQSLARIELAKSKYELAKSELARSTKLLKSNAVSQEEFEERVAAAKEATAEVTVAESDAARTSLDLKYTKITAPISGRIDRAFVTTGNMLTGGLGAGTQLTRIVASSPMYVNFNVDELTMLRYIRAKGGRSESGDENSGQSLREMKIACQIQLQDEDAFAHDGVLDFLETEVDSSTGTIQLRGVFDNEDGL